MNGGAYIGGAGVLLDASGGDTYFSTNHGANGGGYIGGAGLLVDGGGNDTYPAGSLGANGGATGGVLNGAPVPFAAGLLIDRYGDDAYTAERVGTNGGAMNGARGLLLDLDGNDTYIATSEGANGGGNAGTPGGFTMPPGLGLLLDRDEGRDRYEDELVECRDCSVVPKETSGAQVDSGSHEAEAAPEPTEVIGLEAVSDGAAITVSGTALFGGQAPVTMATDPAGDAPGGDAGREAGIDLTEAFVSQPAPDDPTLVFEWRLTHLPTTGSVPEGVRYTLPFRIGDSQFQLQAKLTNLASMTLADDPNGHARPPGHFQLRGDCTTDWNGTGIPNCPHLAWLEGEFDTGTDTVRVEVPLGESYAPQLSPGAQVVKNTSTDVTVVDIMAALQAVVSSEDAADSAVIEEDFAYRIPTKDVRIELFAESGIPVGPVASADLTPGAGGTFVWDLDVSGLEPGSYEVRATACFGGNCGVVSIPLTI